MNRFVILATPRTGSNMLCSQLQSHPNVLCHHEIFNPSGIFLALPLRNDQSFSLGSLTERDNDPVAFLENVWRQSLGHKSVGFKMTNRQQLDVFKVVCSDPDIHKIVLKRGALLKTYVSNLIAEQSGVWEDYRSGVTTKPPQPVTVDYHQLHEALKLNNAYYAELDRLIVGSRTDLMYETLSDTQTQKRLLVELGLEDWPLTVSSRQQNPFSFKQLISNFDPLVERLSHSPNDAPLLKELTA